MSGFEHARLAGLALMLGSVLMVGIPFWPSATIDDRFQQILEPLAIDVSMTPVTADMPGLLDVDNAPLYRYPIEVVSLRGGLPLSRRALETLPLERFKVPALLYLNRRLGDQRVPELRYALCATLMRETGPVAIDGFVLSTPDDPSRGRALGLNTPIACPQALE